MANVRGCDLPDELLYDVPNNMWYREDADGTVLTGMTSVALALAGQLVAVTPRKAGRAVQAGKSCATIESGKWVGPAKIAFDGEVTAVNDALVASPKTANADPYQAGWLIRVKPADWAAAKRTLVPGTQVAAPYDAKMTADGFAGCTAAAA
jgi:glycine cleavage system H protein